MRCPSPDRRYIALALDVDGDISDEDLGHLISLQLINSQYRRSVRIKAVRSFCGGHTHEISADRRVKLQGGKEFIIHDEGTDRASKEDS